MSRSGRKAKCPSLGKWVRTTLLAGKPAGQLACSPRMRGWSRQRQEREPLPFVFPAHAGVVPPGNQRLKESQCVPRACGGGPSGVDPTEVARRCSPRMRGWSPNPYANNPSEYVFPAHAGVVPLSGVREGMWAGVPRACGGGPAMASWRQPRYRCSPRMRGWSLPPRSHCLPLAVFPAHAGVVPPHPDTRRKDRGVPRACGGGPSNAAGRCSGTQCSPRMRGWSHE